MNQSKNKVAPTCINFICLCKFSRTSKASDLTELAVNIKIYVIRLLIKITPYQANEIKDRGGSSMKGKQIKHQVHGHKRLHTHFRRKTLKLIFIRRDVVLYFH